MTDKTKNLSEHLRALAAGGGESCEKILQDSIKAAERYFEWQAEKSGKSGCGFVVKKRIAERFIQHFRERGLTIKRPWYSAWQEWLCCDENENVLLKVSWEEKQ